MAVTSPVALPPTPAVRTNVFGMRAAVAVSRSPFTFQQQAQAHAGQGWFGDIDLPPILDQAVVGRWRAFYGKLNVSQRVFLFGDPDRAGPMGGDTGTPVLDGAHAARQSTVYLRGLGAAAGEYLAGDYFQLGSGVDARLHMFLDDVAGNLSPTGEASVDIWPSLRMGYADGEALIVDNPRGAFRLASNEIGWNSDQVRLTGFSFSIEEVV